MSDLQLSLLQSIDASLKALLQLAEQRRAPASPVRAAGPAADVDLDDPYADEVVKVKPRDWTGEDFKGQRLSTCPPAFLEALAGVYDFFAKKNDDAGALDTQGRPKSFYDRRTAARARAWATRARATQPDAPVTADEVAWGRSW